MHNANVLVEGMSSHMSSFPSSPRFTDFLDCCHGYASASSNIRLQVYLCISSCGNNVHVTSQFIPHTFVVIGPPVTNVKDSHNNKTTKNTLSVKARFFTTSINYLCQSMYDVECTLSADIKKKIQENLKLFTATL